MIRDWRNLLTLRTKKMMNKLLTDNSENSGIRISHLIYLVIFVFTVFGLVFLAVIFTTPKDELAYKEVFKSETSELLNLKSEEEIILNSYKLLDPEKEIYRIPVERAIKIMAQEKK